MGYKVPVGLSNKHLHLSSKDLETLFGEGYELHPTKPLKQPGQFASEEKVDIVGPKGTDCRVIGVSAPVRESGKLEGTPGVKLIGPKGEVELEKGVIVALRHIHLNPEQAKEAGVADKDVVSVKVGGERGLIFDNVLIRSGEAHEREIHLDTDEGNAAGLKNDVEVEILK